MEPEYQPDLFVPAVNDPARKGIKKSPTSLSGAIALLA